MKYIPPSALVLGIAGLIPFYWGMFTYFVPALEAWTVANLGPRFVGAALVIFYGRLILAFMSGVLWGMVTNNQGIIRDAGLVLSVVPALWALFLTGGNLASASFGLVSGFVCVAMIDTLFWRQGLTPHWWMALRLPLTALAIVPLVVIGMI